MHRHCFAGGNHHVGEKALVAPHKRCGDKRCAESAFGFYGTKLPPRSSSMWMRTISSNELSAAKPRSRARRASMRCGQPSTMHATNGSASCRMRAATRSPAMRRNAAICSATVQHTPGMERLMRVPSASRASPAA